MPTISVRDKMLIPSGIPIGIYVKTSGVLVVGIGEFENSEGKKISPAKKLLYILSCCLVISTDLFNFHISHLFFFYTFYLYLFLSLLFSSLLLYLFSFHVFLYSISESWQRKRA